MTILSVCNKRLRGSSQMLAVAGLLVAMASGSAYADLVNGGRTRDGGVGIGANVGGISAGVSVGGGRSVAGADVSVGRAVGATATVGGRSVANVGVSVGRTVGATATVGGPSVASVGANVAGVGVGATVGGGTLATGCIGTCPRVPGTPGVPGTPPLAGAPIAGLPANIDAPTAAPKVPKMLACASPNGNTTAFNGYPLFDKSGRMLGTIHSVQLNGQAQIGAVSIRTTRKTCAALNGGNFSVAGYSVRGAFEGARLGL